MTSDILTSAFHMTSDFLTPASTILQIEPDLHLYSYTDGSMLQPGIHRTLQSNLTTGCKLTCIGQGTVCSSLHHRCQSFSIVFGYGM